MVEESSRNGGESSSESDERYGLSVELKPVAAGKAGGGEKTAAVRSSVSKSRMRLRPSTLSHGGGLMLARFCRLSKSASQSGKGVGKGGLRGCVGPYLFC